MSEATKEAERIARAMARFEDDVVALFPALQERLHSAVEEYIAQGLEEGDRSFKARMMTAHQVVAMLLGRLEAVALERGIPLQAIEETSSRCVALGREAALVKRSEPES